MYYKSVPCITTTMAKTPASLGKITLLSASFVQCTFGIMVKMLASLVPVTLLSVSVIPYISGITTKHWLRLNLLHH